jgi:transposase-like protein
MAKTRRTFMPEFKAEAVKRVTDQSRSFVEAARDLGVGESTLRSWRQAIVAGGDRAFPGRGNLPPSRRNSAGSAPRTSGSPWSATY